MNLTVELGRIPKYFEVPEIIIRWIRRHDDDEGDDEAQFEHRLQARIVNTTRKRLSGFKYYLTYYAKDGSFLGLNSCRFWEDDEIEAHDHFPIDMRLEIPYDTDRYVFNVRAKKPGMIGKLFWG